MISQLLKAAGWKTGACSAPTAAQACQKPSRLHPRAHADAHAPASFPFRAQMAAGARSRDKRPPCTPPVKQGIRLIDMQAALLLQSRGGSFTVERAGRQTQELLYDGHMFITPWLPFSPPITVLGEDKIRHSIECGVTDHTQANSRRAGKRQRRRNNWFILPGLYVRCFLIFNILMRFNFAVDILPTRPSTSRLSHILTPASL